LATKTSNVELKLASGRNVRAALARPAAAKAPGLLLIHEWWGLNDEMREVAARMADAGYLALSVDLFEGEVASEPDRARALMTGLDAAKAKETMVGWAGWMRRDAGCNGKVGALGFCMGGGWALNTALATPLEAAVIFYGNCAKTAADLAPLKGPVQGHFGRLDQGIPKSTSTMRTTPSRASAVPTSISRAPTWRGNELWNSCTRTSPEARGAGTLTTARCASGVPRTPDGLAEPARRTIQFSRRRWYFSTRRPGRLRLRPRRPASSTPAARAARPRRRACR
jgi:dienelactone hydrolase